jgi:hypothetical protein
MKPLCSATAAVFDACVKGYVNTLGMAKNSVVDFLKVYNSWSQGPEQEKNGGVPDAPTTKAPEAAAAATAGLKVNVASSSTAYAQDDANRELGLIGLGLRTYMLKTQNRKNIRRSVVGFVMRSMRL